MGLNLSAIAKTTFAILALGVVVLFVAASSHPEQMGVLTNTAMTLASWILVASVIIAMLIHAPRFIR